jgi:DNA-binding transcriptional regulator YdaS (Cro superfamily)
MSPGLDRAIRLYGSKNALAVAAGVLPNSVAYWVARGVPARRCVELEALTGIPRESFNPDIFAPREPQRV